MIFYHGSPVGGLTELKPFLSEHGRPYVYFASNPLVALLYAVKPVPKPFSFYPYGFDGTGNVIYSEYFENAFFELYHGKTGYLYQCSNLQNVENPTQINCAYTCHKSVKVDCTEEVPDLYAFFKEQETKGLFRIKRRQEISNREMRFVFGELEKDIETHGLRRFHSHPMSVFTRERFPDIWEIAVNPGRDDKE